MKLDQGLKSPSTFPELVHFTKKTCRGGGFFIKLGYRMERRLKITLYFPLILCNLFPVPYKSPLDSGTNLTAYLISLQHEG